jgi:acid phosphatase family membrane protein YuiD
MNLLSLFQNHVLWSALAAWGLAQGLKIPLDYIQSRRWNWALLLSAGGMPSSHAALAVAAAHAIGLYDGFGSSLFAIAVVICMVVIYDATGIRRQAGIHAQTINVLVDELLKGHPVSENQLREVLGHTPLEVAGGFVLGLVVTQLLWFVWR